MRYVSLPDVSANAADVLLRVQANQHAHDEAYHREIARLTVQRRLAHMALHFSKYTGYLFEPTVSRSRTDQVILDVFIISVSTYNIFNKLLSDRYDAIGYPVNGTFEDFLDYAKVDAVGVKYGNEFRNAMAILSGTAAIAVEKLDHLEPYEYREVLESCVFEINRVSMIHLAKQPKPLLGELDTRLPSVQQRSIFHGL